MEIYVLKNLIFQVKSIFLLLAALDITNEQAREEDNPEEKACKSLLAKVLDMDDDLR